MNPSDKRALLETNPMFAELAPQDIDALLAVTKEQSFPEKTIIITQGDPASDMHIIASGSVKVYTSTEDGKEVPLNILSTGDSVGELALIDGEPRSAHVETLSDVTLLTIHAHDFIGLLRTHPALSIKFLKHLAKMVRQTSKNLENMQTESAVERTHKTLTTLSDAYNSIHIPLTHEDLSLLTGITRPRLTEALHELERQGIIAVSHKDIHIL